MINYALNNDIRNVVFYTYDREGRNLTDGERNEKLIREGRLALHYAEDHKVIDQYSPDADFFTRDILTVANKHFSRALLPSEDAYQRRIQRLRDERMRLTQLLEAMQVQLSDAALETAQSIIELATNAKSLWLSKPPEGRKADLDKLLSNKILNGVTIEFELRKPFLWLAENKENLKWRTRKGYTIQIPTR